MRQCLFYKKNLHHSISLFLDMCAFFTDEACVVRRLYVTVSCVEMRKKIIEIRLPILSRKMYDRENAI